MLEWPEWWSYDVVISPHLVERMQERGFSELELRSMLDDAVGFRPAIAPGRFLISTHHDRKVWEIVVEPDELERILIIVTAYRRE